MWVRAFTVRGIPVPRQAKDRRPGTRRRAAPCEVLVTDWETKTDPAQLGLVGSWCFYRDRSGTLARTLLEEGFIYPDDLPARDPAAFAEIEQFVASNEASVSPGYSTDIQLWPLSRWLQERLYLCGYKHRNRCFVVGFNLGFDLGRCARYWAPARDYYRGGWSLGFWGEFDERGRWHDLRYHPRLLVKSIDPRRTLFAWGGVKIGDQDEHGRAAPFVDLRTLSFSLTNRSLTLERACGAFGDPYAKRPVRYGVISTELLAYLREDVAHTATLFRNCVHELARHPGIGLEPQRLFSPATVASAYIEAMGYRRPLEKFTALAPKAFGWTGPGRNAPR